MMAKTNIVDADILIAGGGGAGLWAALRLIELGRNKKIVIVDKGPAEWGGEMALADGEFEALTPSDNMDEWLEDLIYYFDGLCDQPLMEAILAQSAVIMGAYEKFGCDFLRKQDGALKSESQPGLDHIKFFLPKLSGRGGELMAETLSSRLKRAGIKRLGRIMLNCYLRKDGRVCGAAGFHIRKGEFYIFRAKAVIAASGSGGWKASFGENTATGEGLRMAWDAGAELLNMEFARVHPAPRLFAWEGARKLFASGARFVNGQGENFMAKYSPRLGLNVDPHFTGISMAMELRAGRGPVILDVSGLKDGAIASAMPQNGWQKLNYDKLCAIGVDIFRDNTEWLPRLGNCCGGIDAEIDGSIKQAPGLFAAGSARGLIPGLSLNGFGLMASAVTGYMAAESAVKCIENANPELPGLSNAEMDSLNDKTFAPLQRADKNGLTPNDVLGRIQAAVFPYDVSIIKNGQSLRKALNKLEKISAEDLPRMVAADPHYLLKLREVEAIAFISRLFVMASLAREESRAGHFREDFPHLSPDGPAWLLVAHGKDGEPVLKKIKAVPRGNKIPLTHCYQDNFSFSQSN